MLSAAQIKLVQSDWERVLPIADTAADLFYQRLFELDPKLKKLFKSDLAKQKKKLMQTIGVAVKGLDDLEALVPTIQKLGKKHVGYGVKAEHYDTVGEALLWTLAQGLGKGFGARNRTAWTKVYGVLATTMIDASGY